MIYKHDVDLSWIPVLWFPYMPMIFACFVNVVYMGPVMCFACVCLVGYFSILQSEGFLKSMCGWWERAFIKVCVGGGRGRGG